jgi:hypothetical protein
MALKLKIKADAPEGQMKFTPSYFTTDANKLKFLGVVTGVPTLAWGSNSYNGGQYSIDGGRTWVDVDTIEYDTEYTLITDTHLGSYSQISPDQQNIMLWSWLTGGGSDCIKHLSNDGGVTWTNTFYSSKNYEYTYWNLSSGNGYVGGWANTQGAKTVDNGVTLTEMSSLRNVLGTAPIMFDGADDESIIYSGSAAGKQIGISTDQGTSWDSSIAGGGDAGNFTVVKCSSSGQYVFAYYGTYGRKIWFSNNYASSFIELTDSTNSRPELSRDGNLMVYDDSGSDSSIYVSINKGDTWEKIATPWGSGADIRFRKEMYTRNIYAFAIGHSEVYKIKEDGTGLELLVDLPNNIFSWAPGQYGKGAIYTKYSAGSGEGLYYSKDYYGYAQVKYGENIKYIAIL